MPTITKTVLVSVDLSERLDASPTTFRLWGNNGIDTTRTVDPNQETFVVTAGFASDPAQTQWLLEMAADLRAKNPQANIIIPDWDNRSTLNYAQITSHIGAAGADIANYLQGSGVSANKTTLIGHSLGAHVAGATGNAMKAKPSLIVGLDPAGPILDMLPAEWRLSPGDGQRVVALHTSRTFGSNVPLGDMDVFVNPNSLFQPGSFNAADNHGYAPKLFTELLNGADYGGLNLGALTDPTLQGKFASDTTGSGNTMSGNFQPQFLSALSMWDWIERLQKYVNNKTGETIQPQQQETISNKLNQQANSDIYGIAARLQNGEIGIWQWERETAETLKRLHLQQAILARGGADRMTAEDYLAVGRILKEEYKYLHQLTLDLKSGKISPATLKFRLEMYVKRSRLSYEAMEQLNAEDSGYKYMRRILAFHDRHCRECIQYSSRGLQPIGTLPLPTVSCSCRANCTCRVKYYKDASGNF